LITYTFFGVVAVTVLSSISAEAVTRIDTLEEVTLVYKFVISIYYTSGEDLIPDSN